MKRLRRKRYGNRAWASRPGQAGGMLMPNLKKLSPSQVFFSSRSF